MVNIVGDPGSLRGVCSLANLGHSLARKNFKGKRDLKA